MSVPRLGQFIKVEFDREEDGRWIAEAPEVPGAMAYGRTQTEALEAVGRILNKMLEPDERLVIS